MSGLWDGQDFGTDGYGGVERVLTPILVDINKINNPRKKFFESIHIQRTHMVPFSFESQYS